MDLEQRKADVNYKKTMKWRHDNIDAYNEYVRKYKLERYDDVQKDAKKAYYIYTKEIKRLREISI